MGERSSQKCDPTSMTLSYHINIQNIDVITKRVVWVPTTGCEPPGRPALCTCILPVLHMVVSYLFPCLQLRLGALSHDTDHLVIRYTAIHLYNPTYTHLILYMILYTRIIRI
mgnify:CR=1 FL=1